MDVWPWHAYVCACVQVGRFTESLGFEVLGGEKLTPLMVSGTCDHPHISSDPRNVFYRKARARPQTPTIARQFIMAKNVFEFGPLLHSKVNALPALLRWDGMGWDGIGLVHGCLLV